MLCRRSHLIYTALGTGLRRPALAQTRIGMSHQPRGLASHNQKIGINQRVTPLAVSWTGELRVRFTDFQVNEIDHNGNVVHLTQIGLGQPAAAPQSNAQSLLSDATAEKQNGDSNNDLRQGSLNKVSEGGDDISDADKAILAELGGKSFADEIVALYKSIGPSADYQASATANALDKAKRGQLHQEVRRIFNSQIDTSTNDDGSVIAKLATKKSKSRGRGGRNRGQASKPVGEFLHFTLYKDNRDTMDAVSQLSKIINVKPQFINYAGTKDRRASTAQRCSIRNGREWALANANSKLRGIVTGDYEYSDLPVWLGRLQGNEFTITIKDCKITEESATSKSLAEKVEILRNSAESALKHMTEHGWINYFGNQRFGTREVGTHDIGQLILGDKFEEAVHSLLAYDAEVAEKAEATEDYIPKEPIQRDEVLRHQACMLFMTDKDAERAARIIPRRFAAENCILRHLTRSGLQSRRDFTGAIVHITRGLRSMYLHAYQSHVWNHVASRRWELYGDKVVAGDLVLVEQETKTAYAGKDQDGDDIFNPVDDDNDGSPTLHARPVTEEEAVSRRFTIFDIVLPVPGYDITYPTNDIGAYYKEFMGLPENGGLDPHNMRRRHREFSLPGRYRKVIGRFLPGGVGATPSVEVRTYTDDTEQMHPTDLDIVRAKMPSRNAKRSAPSAEEDEERQGKKQKVDEDGETLTAQETEPSDADNIRKQEIGTAKEPMGNDDTVIEEATSKATKPADKIAVLVKFRLGSSAYATVTLRELMGDPPEEVPAQQ